MAGIGFSLRKLRSDETYAGGAQLYLSAAVLSSGPWLISILGLLFVGILAQTLAPTPNAIVRFQVAVTWLFAVSLVLTTPFQLLFTRYVSDLIFAEQDERVLPNLWGALACTSAAAALVGAAAWPWFDDCALAVKALLAANLVVLSNIWIAVVMLTGLKEHRKVLLMFALGNAVTVAASLALARAGEAGLLAGFLAGQSVLLWGSCAIVARAQPSVSTVAWGFLDRRRIYPGLLGIGFLYAMGTWIDKLVFWLYPLTSTQVIGPLRSSEIYDLPIFLAYLAITPGMAVFLLRIETDYAELHTAFFRAVEDGATLRAIEAARDAMTQAARRACLSIFKVQGITFLLCAVFGRELLRLFGISRLHAPLLRVDAAAVSLQVLLLALVSVFFYLDRRRVVLGLTALLCLSNGLATALSLRLGVAWFGYGFAFSMAITVLVAILTLRHTLRHLVRDTFMLQAAGA